MPIPHTRSIVLFPDGAIQGYLTQQEWGYPLAIYAFMKEERNPDWIRFLSPNILADYKNSEAYAISDAWQLQIAFFSFTNLAQQEL